MIASRRRQHAMVPMQSHMLGRRADEAIAILYGSTVTANVHHVARRHGGVAGCGAGAAERARAAGRCPRPARGKEGREHDVKRVRAALERLQRTVVGTSRPSVFAVLRLIT